MKKIIKIMIPLIDVLLVPSVYLAAIILKYVKKAGMQRMPCCKHTLIRVGVFPILDHYYEPLFDSQKLRKPLNEDRCLPGVDWNTEEQLSLLKSCSFNNELENIPVDQADKFEFYMNNPSFQSGDAEFLYNLIRLKKPTRIIEIGSGYSTLLAIQAVKINKEENSGYDCKHVCIEPYEMPWLENAGVSVIRQRVEDVDKDMFSNLGKDDILFIDSSHIIRPQGDVLFEYLELLPTLKAGVIVHVHDIFSPKDYLKEWVIDKMLLWNEQYLLEAFLSCNRDWKIIGALNYLHHNYYKELKAVCPFLTEDREPGSFYVQKIA
jgi:predicted O-methyltransferase YrrM